MAYNGKIFGCVSIPYSAGILIKSNIQNPMDFVFNSPMSPDIFY